MLVDDGVMIFKFYLNISKETQAKRIKDKMFEKSGSFSAPWCMIDANDKKRARLNLIRFLLLNIEYDNRNNELIQGVDEEIVTFFAN